MRTSVLATLLAAAILAGCTSHKTVSDNGTTVTTSGTGQDQTVTVQGQGGSYTTGKDAVDLATLGVPVYPGASTDSSNSMSGSGEQGSGSVVVLKTTDAFDKVYGWYKGQMPAGSQQMESTSGGSSVAEFKIGADDAKTQKVVTITSDTDGTQIMIVVGTKNQ